MKVSFKKWVANAHVRFTLQIYVCTNVCMPSIRERMYTGIPDRYFQGDINGKREKKERYSNIEAS